MTGHYGYGQWHALIGLDPQYDHMTGTPMYDEYMAGYNAVKNCPADSEAPV
jgi:hypothetical protein